MADPDEALIEAIAEAICESDSDWSEQSDRFKDAYRQYARAAYAALVAHLGLVEETRKHERIGPGKCSCGFDAYRNAGIMADYTALTQAHFRAVRLGKVPTGRRLVSRWTEVDHGSE